MSARRPNITRRLVPLLDVVFLLLIFFIVLPHGTRAVQAELAKPPDWSTQDIARFIELRLTEDGKVWLGENAYPIDQLARRLAPRPGEKSMVLVRVAWSAKQRDYLSLRGVLDAQRLVYVVLQEPR